MRIGSRKSGVILNGRKRTFSRSFQVLLRTAAVAAFAVAVALAAPAQDPPKKSSGSQDDSKDPFRVHIRMHRQVAPKIVQVRGGSQTGTGVIIRSDGLILTSPTACGTRTSEARVVLTGSRRVVAQVIGRRNDLELALLKVDLKDLPVMEFADSTKARLGQISYAFGDVWDSIAIDDQVAMSLGIVSGRYDVTSTLANSLYTGPVIETSAAVNQNLDGGPLVDAQGKMLGMITLNYHPAKFTGIAIPSHILKPAVDRMIKDFTDGVVSDKESGFVGIAVAESPGEWTGVKITEVASGSPAEKAGLKEGDQILRIDTDRVTSIEKFDQLTQEIRPSTKIRFQVRRGGKDLDIQVTAAPRAKPKTEY
jgi:S1-C subfamily serine protease